jgi:hypothetical protein
MINYSDITKGIETILRNNLSGYTITRNDKRLDNPSVAAKNKGWIGIYRGPVNYDAYAIGARVWICTARPIVEVQAVSMKSGADAEDKLESAVDEVMECLNSNRTLNSTVLMSMGYEIRYEFNADTDVWYHSAIITITAEVRA